MKSTERPQTQLTTKGLIWLYIALGFALLPHIPRMPFWFVPLVIAVFTYRYYAQVRQLKRIYTTFLMLIALLTLALIVYSQGLGLSREISVTILITMTVLKLLESHISRDALMITILCYFIVITRFLYNQDITMLLYMLISVYLTTHTLGVIHAAGSPRVLDKKELKKTASMLALSVPVAVLFFLVFPRLGSPIWGSPDLFGQGTTGISDEMSPGSIINLIADDSPAFRVTFSDGAYPPNSALYWRGPVLWHFDGTTWRRQKHRSLRRTLDAQVLAQRPQLEYEMEMEPSGQNYLFPLDWLVDPPQGHFILPDGILYSPIKINQLKHFNMKSVLADPMPMQLTQNHRDLLLQLPPASNPKTRALMQRWRTELRSEQALIERVLDWFRTDRFAYSLSPPPLSGNTVDEFLFDSKEGFCEHYASAFTFMMRAAGIPARVVTGYQGGLDNGEYLLVRQSDAHAWSEVYLADGRWHRVDPTAAVSPQRVRSGNAGLFDERRGWFDYAWVRTMRNRYDALRYDWNRWVRSFSSEQQAALFELMGFERFEARSFGTLIAAVFIVTSALFALFFWLANRATTTEPERIWRAFLRAFKLSQADGDVGVDRVCRRLSHAHPELALGIAQFRHHYIRARYGHRDQTRHLEKTRAALERLRRSLSAGSSEA